MTEASEPAHHREGGAGHGQALAVVDHLVRPGNPLPGHVLTEVDDVGFEHPTTHFARRDNEIAGGFQHGIGVGGDLHVAHLDVETWVEDVEAHLHVRPGDAGAAL